MANFIKLYDKQGIPVGFTECTAEVESALGDANVVFYDENGLPLGFRIVTFDFDVSVTLSDGSTTTLRAAYADNNRGVIISNPDNLSIVKLPYLDVNAEGYDPEAVVSKAGTINYDEIAEGDGVHWTAQFNPSFNPDEDEGPGNWGVIPFTKGYGRGSSATGWYTWITIQ